MTFGSSQPTAVLGAPETNGGAAGADRGGPPQRGALGIRQRRSWRTWHLLTAIVVALVLGMIIGNDSSSGGGAGTSPNGAAKQTYTPPPPAGSTGSATSTTVTSSPTTTQAALGGQSAANSSTTTTSTAPSTSGSPTVLLPAKQARGDWTSPPFTVGAAPWSLGWAYQCTPAPAPGSAFQIFVSPVGGPQSSTAAVKETAASGQSVTSQSSTGQEEVSVEAPTGCEWIVKVTGVA